MFMKIPDIPKVSDFKMPSLSLPQVKLTVFGGSLKTGAYIVAAFSLAFGALACYNGVHDFFSGYFATLEKEENEIEESELFHPDDIEDIEKSYRKLLLRQLVKISIHIAIAVAWVVLSAVMAVGVYKEKRRFIFLWLCASAAGLLCLLGLTLYRSFFWYGIDSTSFQLICFMMIWFYSFDIVFSHYKQLKERANSIKSNLSHQVLTTESITNDSLIKPTDSCIA